MGTHPIFESDFDCLTEKSSVKIADSTVSYTCKMNNEDSVESKNSGENTLAADNESIERKNEDTSMESGSPNSSESTESENQEESERSVSEDNLEESKEDFLFEIEKNLRNGHYKDYYYSMPPYFNQDHTFKEARRQENREKNRYIDIMPYDKTRVILNVNSGGTSGKDESSSTSSSGGKDSADAQGDYINANYVNMLIGDESSSDKKQSAYKRKWIASQGPLDNTKNDFWKMIYDSNASLIVMVTQTRELGRPKCEDYWPEEAEPVYFNNPDSLTVRLLSEEQEKEGLIARVLQFKSEDGSTRNVNHIQFVDWPDHGVPHDPAHFLTFLRRIRELKKESDDEVHTIVHCSAGVGRTGVTIALDAAWERLQNGLTVDPKQLLEEMRNQRGCLIQTVQQFLFVCNTILHLAEEIKSQQLSASKNNCNLSERSKRELSSEDHKDSKTNDKQENSQETVI